MKRPRPATKCARSAADAITSATPAFTGRRETVQRRRHRVRGRRDRHRHPLRHPRHARQGHRLRHHPHLGGAPRRGVDNIIYVSIVGYRPHSLGVLQVEAACRGSVGGVRPRPHDHSRHPIPRLDRDDVLGAAVLTCARWRSRVCASSRSTPATWPPIWSCSSTRGPLRSRRGHRRANCVRPRRTRANVSCVTQQPSACAVSPRAGRHRRRSEVWSQPGARQPRSERSAFAVVPFANSMTFACALMRSFVVGS